MKLVLQSPAKINLGLYIRGKRPDGFHELETLFQMVSLYDTLELEDRKSGVELLCDHPDIPSDESNLVVRAARLLQAEVPAAAQRGCRILLKKKIPSGAGLGGGSGNAALALWGLNRLWDLGLERPRLRNFAAQLGSDIPFFLSAPAALGRGRGEQLTPLQPSKKFYVILIFPRVNIATSEVYQNLNLDLTKNKKNISILHEFFSQSDVPNLGAHLHNDLEPVVFKRYPAVQAVRDRLVSTRADGVLVSGSGSTVFAIFEQLESAQSAAKLCAREDWDLFLTETVSDFSEFLPESVINYPSSGQNAVRKN